MKTSIATISTDIGTMTIYYNGANEAMTAETADVIDELEYKPCSMDEATKTVAALYCQDCWELCWIED